MLELSYSQRKGKGCLFDQYGSYATLELAKAACVSDSNCEAVVDSDCDDGDSTPVSLCSLKATFTRSAESCVYIKKGIYFIIDLPLLN